MHFDVAPYLEDAVREVDYKVLRVDYDQEYEQIRPANPEHVAGHKLDLTKKPPSII